MKISNEVKVGIIGIATIAVLIWGINYLKGRNIFNKTYTLYTFYAESGGLEISSPVLFNGVKIGFVDEVKLRTTETPSVKVVLNIEKEYSFGRGSVAELISADLLGTKAISIAASGAQRPMQDLDTIRGSVASDLISSLESSLFPILDKVDLLAGSLDTLSRHMDTLFSRDALAHTLDHLSSVAEALKNSLSAGGSLDNSFTNLESFTGALEKEKAEMASLVKNLNSISGTVDRAGLDTLSREMTQVLHQFNILLGQVNSKEGSAGKLFYSDTLHETLVFLLSDLDSLVRDLNEHPEDYVQISLFGKSNKKKQ